jgi:hypothetical protein
MRPRISPSRFKTLFDRYLLPKRFSRKVVNRIILGGYIPLIIRKHPVRNEVTGSEMK